MRKILVFTVLVATLIVSPPMVRGEEIGAILPGHIQGFWRGLARGMEHAARDLDVRLLLRATTDGVALDRQQNVQLRLIDYMVRQGVAGIVLAPEALAGVAAPIATPVPLVLVDRDGPQFQSLSVVSTDNFQAGRRAALSLEGILPKGANVAVLRLSPNIPSTMAREEGIIGVAGEKGWNVALAPFVGHQLRESEGSIAQALGAYTGQVDAVFASNESLAYGAVRLIRSMPAQSRPLLVIFDWRPEFGPALADGTVHAAVLQDVERMGYRAIAAVLAACRGETIPARESIDVAVVTKANMNDPAIRGMMANYGP